MTELAAAEAGQIAEFWLADLEEETAAGLVADLEEYRNSVRGLLRRLRARLPSDPEDEMGPYAILILAAG